ncbi:unnamed protein product [Pleuronectes platessa]|uniref:Uncharacterized protein n=1 Tax=Pleuronectes platessa TaxID=8262 RepID=A0A9N7Y8R3_PLEPL|nr:unnamed protein product [Pleuronectes platessa]
MATWRGSLSGVKGFTINNLLHCRARVRVSVYVTDSVLPPWLLLSQHLSPKRQLNADQPRNRGEIGIRGIMRDKRQYMMFNPLSKVDSIPAEASHTTTPPNLNVSILGQLALCSLCVTDRCMLKILCHHLTESSELQQRLQQPPRPALIQLQENPA